MKKIIITAAHALLCALLFISCRGKEKALATSNTNDHPVARLLRYEVKNGFVNRFRALVNDYILYSLTLENNILSEGYYEKDNSSVVWIVERWQNAKSLERMRKSNAWRMIQAAVDSGLVSKPVEQYVTDLEPLPKEQWRRKADKAKSKSQ